MTRRATGGSIGGTTGLRARAATPLAATCLCAALAAALAAPLAPASARAQDVTRDAIARDTTPRDTVLPPAPGTPEAEVRIAQRLLNPVSTVSALPLASDFDYDLGPAAGYRYTLEVRRAASRRVSRRWRIVSHSLLPVVGQRDVAGTSGGQFGIGDVLQSTVLTPARLHPTAWGAGAALRLPTGTDSLLGTGLWSAGPEGTFVRQTRAWTLGASARHLWSFAGPSSRPDVNATDLLPFFWWTNATALTLGGDAEVTYDWTVSRWRAVLHVGGSQVITVNSRSASVGLYSRAFPGGGDDAPRWGLRFVVTLVFPRPD